MIDFFCTLRTFTVGGVVLIIDLKKKSFYLGIKRIFSFLCALLGLIVLSPLFLFLCIWILIDDGRPIFFTQKRVGKNKKHFKIYKFRTMRNDAPHDMPTHLLEDPEKHITKSGKFLRKTSLDELPQLFNILKGDLDVVSVRPALWNQYDLIEARDESGANMIRPGLTGWAQTHGRDEVSVQEKAALDAYYVEHMSLWTDVKVIFITLLQVVKGSGVSEGGPKK